MPGVLLDTNAVSDLMRDDPKVKARVASYPDSIQTSVIAVGEIRYGLDRLPLGKKRVVLENRAKAVFVALPIEQVTQPIAETNGHLKATMQCLGLSPYDNDLWIAATGLALGYTVVTRDHIFSQVPGLQVEDWSA